MRLWTSYTLAPLLCFGRGVPLASSFHIKKIKMNKIFYVSTKGSETIVGVAGSVTRKIAGTEFQVSDNNTSAFFRVPASSNFKLRVGEEMKDISSIENGVIKWS